MSEDITNEEYKQIVAKNMRLIMKELKERQSTKSGKPLTGYVRIT